MKDEQLDPIVLAVAAEWQAGGLGPDTMYGEFAMEVARRAVAAERERCAKIVDMPPGTEAWEVIGGEEGLTMLRELAAQIRGA